MEKTGMAKISRTAKKKRRARLLLFITLSLVFVFIFALVFNLIFKVDNLTVVNNTEYSDEELIAASGFSEGTPMLFLHESSVSENVSLKLPYVESVHLEKNWPTSVTATFNAAVPKYIMEIGESSYLIVSEGLKVLGTANSFEEGYVPIKGISVETYESGKKLSETANIEIGLLVEITNCLKSGGLYDRLTSVDFTKKHNYIIVLDSAVTVELGTSDDLDKKVDKLREILTRNSGHTKMNISVRDYTSGRCTILD